jgi:hypothetical protein
VIVRKIGIKIRIVSRMIIMIRVQVGLIKTMIYLYYNYSNQFNLS